MTTAFVTGATGLLGGNLVRLLLDSGYQVRALVRSPDKARELPAHPRLEIVPGTLPAVDGFAERLAGSDVLFHTAAHFRDSYKGGSHWTELQRVNVDGTRALVAAAWRAGVRRLVHTSSVAVVRSPDPTRPADETMPRDPDTEPDDYYRSKILADRVVDDALRRHTDLHATFVLPGS